MTQIYGVLARFQAGNRNQSWLHNLADRWTDSGITYDALKMDVLNTSYAAASQLVNILTSGTQRFGVRAPHNALGTDVTPFLNMTDVWNTSGTAVGLKYNVTDTASGANSLLFQLQANSTNAFTVTKGGVVTSTGNYNIGSDRGFIWGGRSILSSPANGNFLMQNQAQTDFGRLILGLTTSSGASIKRNGTGIDIRNGDDTAFTAVKGKLTTDTNYTAGDPVTTGYLTVYDGAGTAYKIPAVAA